MPVYQKSGVAWFCSKDDPRWELSNMAGKMEIFWPRQQIKANRWNSSEQLYQACKYSTAVECLLQDKPDADPNVRRRIFHATNARAAKMTQKCAVAAGLVRENWEAPENVRLKAMLWVLELKAFWNAKSFGRVLRKTGSLPIVEILKKDAFWGCKDDGAGTRVGENNLGLLLMQVRDRLPEIVRGQFTYPAGFLLP